ncbi:hypothetical protein C0J52_00309 [Blattella germanica]|nr:hypothetical protein C0J52_00309 [Blattella germanica]
MQPRPRWSLIPLLSHADIWLDLRLGFPIIWLNADQAPLFMHTHVKIKLFHKTGKPNFKSNEAATCNNKRARDP